MTPPPRQPHSGQPRRYRPGLIAGAVLQAARRSASLSRTALAASLGVSRNAVRRWEDGTSPLASVLVSEIERLEGTLAAGGADRLLIADLSTALWCDLLIAAVDADEDIRCLLADPVTCERAFGELLSWASAGVIPARYRQHFAALPLLTDRVQAEHVLSAVGQFRPDLAVSGVPTAYASTPRPTSGSHPRGSGRRHATPCPRPGRQHQPAPARCRRKRI